MPRAKIFAMLVSLLALLSCSHAPARNPIDPAARIALNIVDTPDSPLVTARLWQQKDSIVISGEVHKRNAAPLNGYVFLSIIGPDGRELWWKRAELSPSGLRFFRYRLFDEHGPSLPPAGSKVVVGFQKLDEAMKAELFTPDVSTIMTL